ncbi:TPA: hypothetical protein PKO72_002192 [Aeromonas hydrophila]|uniref:hypothetical protein n=1 Tax=Aeromonas hydrophila TaxID=644 RepID=UPI001CCE125E|nr:hypothetical protein [Aeromonas hydrophila]UBQ50555.1 hypothetical protein LCH17_00025 [Aeromonas hydrophila]HDI1213463.1 hypothetical protein [Aeromonas hydrophila]
MNNMQTVSREEYRRLDNRVTCILQQRWPANEINQWVGMLQGKQQAIACAILRRRHPRPASLALPAIAAEVPNPFQAQSNRPTVPVLTADGRQVGRRHIVEGLPPVVIDHSGTIRCARTGRTLWIAPGSRTDRANLGAAEQLNKQYQPSQHQVVADHRQDK